MQETQILILLSHFLPIFPVEKGSRVGECYLYAMETISGAQGCGETRSSEFVRGGVITCCIKTEVLVDRCQRNQTPYTVVFYSVRWSRVTGPQIHEYFRGCHGSPRPTTNLQKKVTKTRKMRQKTHFFFSRGTSECLLLRGSHD
jgi:hypothetical protein